MVREIEGQPYRVAQLRKLEEVAANPKDLFILRHRMISVFDHGTLLATVIGRQFRQLLSSSLPTEDIADLIAFNFLEDVALKQSLLAETDVATRVLRIVTAFEAVRPALEPSNYSPGKPGLN